jgi:hypothetical protein
MTCSSVRLLATGSWLLVPNFLAGSQEQADRSQPSEAIQPLQISGKSGSFKMHWKKAFRQVLERSEKFREIFSMEASWRTIYSNQFFFSLW